MPDTAAMLNRLIASTRAQLEQLEALRAELTGGSAPPVSANGKTELTADDLRAICMDKGIPIHAGNNLVYEDGAALLVDRATKTLRNWRATDGRLPFVMFVGRVAYRLEDLADFINSQSRSSP